MHDKDTQRGTTPRRKCLLECVWTKEQGEQVKERHHIRKLLPEIDPTWATAAGWCNIAHSTVMPGIVMIFTVHVMCCCFLIKKKLYSDLKSKIEINIKMSRACHSCLHVVHHAVLFYQPLQDIKKANPLFSRVSEKTNHTRWEPLFLEESIKTQPCPASSCLSVGMTSARGPVTDTAGPSKPAATFKCCSLSQACKFTHSS